MVWTDQKYADFYLDYVYDRCEVIGYSGGTRKGNYTKSEGDDDRDCC